MHNSLRNGENSLEINISKSVNGSCENEASKIAEKTELEDPEILNTSYHNAVTSTLDSGSRTPHNLSDYSKSANPLLVGVALLRESTSRRRNVHRMAYRLAGLVNEDNGTYSNFIFKLQIKRLTRD